MKNLLMQKNFYQNYCNDQKFISCKKFTQIIVCEKTYKLINYVKIFTSHEKISYIDFIS